MTINQRPQKHTTDLPDDPTTSVMPRNHTWFMDSFGYFVICVGLGSFLYIDHWTDHLHVPSHLRLRVVGTIDLQENFDDDEIIQQQVQE